jgi:hypothetical protein
MMQVIQEQENQKSLNEKQALGDGIEKKPMHPDDFAALLAWVTAKRFHELVLEKTFAEMPVYYRYPG